MNAVPFLPGTRPGRFGYWNPPFVVTVVLMMFVIARYMQWGARRDILATIRIEFLMGIGLTIASIVYLQSAPLNLGRLPGTKRVILAISLLFLCMIIQLPLAAAPDLAWTVFFDRVIKFAMLTLFIAVLVRSPDGVRAFLFAFILGCFYVTQESARGAFSGGLIWENQGIMRLHGAVPIYRHPNSLAGVAMGVVPFIAFLLPAVKSRLWQLALLPPLATSLVCLLYSGSRTGYVAFFSFMVYWWLQSRRKLRWILVAGLIGAAAVPILPEQYIGRFKSIGGEEAEGNSKEKRVEILEDAVAIFMKNPLGVGVASFPEVRKQMFGRSQDTHNLYLEVATNLGIQGLVVFFFLIYAMLSSLKRVQRRFEQLAGRSTRAIQRGRPDRRQRAWLERSQRDAVFLRSATQATAGFLWVRLALGLFGMDLYEVYWWFAAGLTISLDLVAHSMSRSFAKTVPAIPALAENSR